MKVTSFTGTFVAARTHSHSDFYPDKQAIQEYMEYNSIDFDTIKDFQATDDYIAISCNNAADKDVIRYFDKHKLKYFKDPEIKPLRILFEEIAKMSKLFK